MVAAFVLHFVGTKHGKRIGVGALDERSNAIQRNLSTHKHLLSYQVS